MLRLNAIWLYLHKDNAQPSEENYRNSNPIKFNWSSCTQVTTSRHKIGWMNCKIVIFIERRRNSSYISLFLIVLHLVKYNIKSAVSFITVIIWHRNIQNIIKLLTSNIHIYLCDCQKMQPFVEI